MTAPRVRDFRDLKAWQKAMELALLCDEGCQSLPPSARYLALQIRRAANSIHANIAEGNGRFTRPDYLRYLVIANGSLRELESHLHFVARRFGTNSAIDRALEHTFVTGKLLAGLTRSLRTPSGK
ncbi:MAG: four helix bundle protein [Gemmatimonadota bacterium]